MPEATGYRSSLSPWLGLLLEKDSLPPPFGAALASWRSLISTRPRTSSRSFADRQCSLAAPSAMRLAFCLRKDAGELHATRTVSCGAFAMSPSTARVGRGPRDWVNHRRSSWRQNLSTKALIASESMKMGLTESTERSSRFLFPTMSRLGSRLSPYRLGRKSGQSRMCTSLTSFKKACSSRLLEAVGPAPRLSAFIPRGEGFFFESCLGWVERTLRATPSAVALLGSGRGPRRSSLAGGLYQGFKGRAFSSAL